MATPYTKPQVEDKKNLALQVDQLIATDGTAVDVADIVAVVGDGLIILPTADPEVVGALWNNEGTVTVSAGP